MPTITIDECVDATGPLAHPSQNPQANPAQDPQVNPGSFQPHVPLDTRVTRNMLYTKRLFGTRSHPPPRFPRNERNEMK